MRGNRLQRVDSSTEEQVVTAPRVSLSSPAQFYRSLGFLYRSGYSLSRSFKLLAGGMEDQAQRLLCLRLYSEVRKGRSLVESFRVCGFPTTLVGALEAGEQSGNIEGALFWYAQFEERNQEIRRQLQQALLYPLLTLAFTLMLAVLLPPLVLKEQLASLAQGGAELPFLSKLLFWVSQALTHPSVLLLPLAMFMFWQALQRWASRPEGRCQLERLLGSVPLLGEALRRAAGARALALMALILKSGAPATTALLVASQGCGSRLLKGRLQHSITCLVEGATFAGCLREADWFAASSLHLIEAGEAVGDPGSMVNLSSELEEDKLREGLETFAAVLQPAVMLLVGVLVCLTIIAVLGPSLSLISNI